MHFLMKTLTRMASAGDPKVKSARSLIAIKLPFTTLRCLKVGQPEYGCNSAPSPEGRGHPADLYLIKTRRNVSANVIAPFKGICVLTRVKARAVGSVELIRARVSRAWLRLALPSSHPSQSGPSIFRHAVAVPLACGQNDQQILHSHRELRTRRSTGAVLM